MTSFWQRVALLVAYILSVRASSAQQVTIEIPYDQAGPAIPSDYLGISTETGSILARENGWHRYSPSNKSLVQLYKTIGVASLRVGGDQVDAAECAIPTRTDIDELFAFAKALNIRVIYSFRLKVSPDGKDPDAASIASTAKYITDHYGDQLDCFEIGNEPNNYKAPYTLTYEQFYAKWSRLASAVTAKVPEAKFAGPATAGRMPSWCPQFARDAKADFGDHLSYVCQHHYFGGSGKFVASPSTARAKLVGPAILDDYQMVFDSFVPACKELGLGYRLEETNSFSRGGTLQVSNTLASALWALQYLYWWAEHDSLGINFHTGDWTVTNIGDPPGNPYAVYWATLDGDKYQAQPLAYAMTAFALGSRGKRVPVRINVAPTSLSAFATISEADRSLNLTLINVGPNEVDTRVRTRNREQALVYVLSTPAHDLADESGVTLAGAKIQGDGTWSGTPITISADHGTFDLHIPPASAVVITTSRH